MSYINMSLDVIKLSERTRNALMKKNNIHTTNDLWNIRDRIQDSVFFKIGLKGIGRKGIKELLKAIDIIKDDFLTNTDKILEKEEINDQENSNLDNYFNTTYYIPTKINKTNGSYNQRHERKKVLNDYLCHVYKGDNEFELESLIKVFLDSLSDVEIGILKHRLLFLEKNYVLPLGEIAKIGKITHERVRQVEESLLKKINEIFTGFSHTKIGIDYKNILLETHKIGDYGVLDFSEHRDDYINGKFLAYVNAAIVGSSYDCYYLNKEHKTGEILLICKKNLLDKKILNKLFVNIDKIYIEKRPEDKSLIKDVLISKITKKYITIYLNNPGYEYAVFKYLGNAYNIFQINGVFVLPQNKKDLKFLVRKELESLEGPIHFTQMYEIVSKKYPDYVRNHGKIQHALMQHGKNVGNGLYVKTSYHMKGGTIGDIAEEYIRKKGESIKYSELVNHILENKVVKKSSIETLLFKQDKQKRFVRIEGDMIGLTEHNPPNIVKSRKTYKLDEDIYELLKKNNISEFTINEIIEKIGGSINYQRVKLALNKLTDSGKISYLTKGITNYYYVL